MPVTASSADQSAIAMIAKAGVPKRGCTTARRSKNTPSRAIAKYRRGAVSRIPFAALKIETRISTPTSLSGDGAEHRDRRHRRRCDRSPRRPRSERGDVAEVREQVEHDERRGRDARSRAERCAADRAFRLPRR